MDKGMDQEEPHYFRIGMVAKRLRIHPQTLRLYEREGLIRPERSGGNTRRYSRVDVERVERILWLTREMGVNLAGVEIILDMREKMDRMHQDMFQLMERVRELLVKELKKKTG
jgi:MerR family transcriptional regulator/heat shock protein HspR